MKKDRERLTIQFQSRAIRTVLEEEAQRQSRSLGGQINYILSKWIETQGLEQKGAEEYRIKELKKTKAG